MLITPFIHPMVALDFPQEASSIFIFMNRLK
jgi:hypothetical protein